MILAVLDDLLFTSKIRTTANQLGVPIAFARSSEGALSDMRKNPPSLVIFDLNNPRTDPMRHGGSDESGPCVSPRSRRSDSPRTCRPTSSRRLDEPGWAK